MLILALTAASVLMLSLPSYSAEGFFSRLTKSSRSHEGSKKKHKQAHAKSHRPAQAPSHSSKRTHSANAQNKVAPARR
jgi:hypothetical protein